MRNGKKYIHISVWKSDLLSTPKLKLFYKQLNGKMMIDDEISIEA